MISAKYLKCFWNQSQPNLQKRLSIWMKDEENYYPLESRSQNYGKEILSSMKTSDTRLKQPNVFNEQREQLDSRQQEKQYTQYS